MFKHLILIFAGLLCVLAVNPPVIYTYKTVGNLTIQCAVYQPTTKIFDKYPVILLIHGGGYLVGSDENGASSVQELVEMVGRGWVVVSIDYRLSPYVFMADMVEDVQDAYTWIRTELVNVVEINPDAIAVWGDSAGAGLTVIAGYKLTPRPQAIISFYAYCTDWTTDYGYNPNTPVSQQLVDAANALRTPLTEYTAVANDPRWGLFGLAQAEQKGGWLFTTSDPNADPATIMAELKGWSAVDNIDSSYPPTYLIHGLIDGTVPYSQSLSMSQVLKQNNVTYVIDLVPGVGHAFDLGGVNQVMWQQHIAPIFNFTAKYISHNSTTTNEIEI